MRQFIDPSEFASCDEIFPEVIQEEYDAAMEEMYADEEPWFPTEEEFEDMAEDAHLEAAFEDRYEDLVYPEFDQ